VTHIVSVVEYPPTFSERLTTLHVAADDLPQTDLLCRLEETTAFITRALEDPDAVVLVHCLMVRLQRYLMFKSLC
jgi:hypothetical protein